MRLKYIFLILIVLNLIPVFGNSLNIELQKTLYGPGSLIDGNIVLNLTNELDLGLNPYLSVSLGERNEKRKVLDILTGLDPNLNIRKNSINATNPGLQKDLILNQNGLFGFRLLKGSEVTKLDFDIEGINNNGFPNFPFVDFQNDNSYEWFYVGSFSSWGTETVNVNGLSNVKAGTSQVQDNSFLECGIINLPFSNTFKVSINAEIVDNSGDLSMYIFDFDKATNTGGTKRGECNLEDQGSNILGCIINTTTFVNGEHLICFYNKLNQGDYNLAVDESGESRYRCDPSLIDSDNGQCSLFEDGDLFIKFNKPLFSAELNKKVKFSSFSLQDELLSQINNYLSNCESDSSDECSVYFNSGSSNNKGTLRLNNLILEYTKPDGRQSVLRNIYNINKISAKILGLKTGIFHNYTLRIPFDVFENLTVPNITVNSTTMRLKTEFASLSSFIDINVDKNLVLTARNNLEVTKHNIEKFKSDEKINEFLTIIGINLDTILSNVDSLDAQLISLDNGISSESQKNELANNINNQLSEIIGNLPKLVTLREDVDYPRIYPEKINPQILGNANEEEVLRLQDDVNIVTSARLFSVVDSKGSYEKTLIKREVSSNLNEFSIAEEIPKDVALSSSLINFSGEHTVINEDPIISWNLNGNGEVKYVLNGNVLSKLNKITTTVLTTEVKPVERPKEANCGDGVCTEILEDEVVCPADCKPKYVINWSITIILLIVLISGLIYFNFFMGKRSIKEFVVKKSPFTSSTDETNLRNYVQKALSKNVSRNEIYKILFSKKWTKEQIDYVFKKVSSPKKPTNFLSNLLIKIKSFTKK